MNGIRTAARQAQSAGHHRPIRRREVFGPLARLAVYLVFPLLTPLGGCTFITGPTASFTTPTAAVRAECERMKANPVGLTKPLVVIDGWRQFDWSSAAIASSLRSLTGAPKADVMPVSFPTHTDMNAMANEIVMRVERRWPSQDPDWTVEVDVVGHSMGGLVARIAALESHKNKDRKRLRIRSLYTISTPHRGARMAPYFPIDSAVRQMRPGSKTLARLDKALPDVPYELVCYTQLNDWTVGAKNTAPPGREPIWVEGTFFASHMLAKKNTRILGDIALRLRGEPPMAQPSLAPPCN
jgi:pimeloyl-ACP methyl ester carboxylesterase